MDDYSQPPRSHLSYTHLPFPSFPILTRLERPAYIFNRPSRQVPRYAKVETEDIFHNLLSRFQKLSHLTSLDLCPGYFEFDSVHLDKLVTSCSSLTSLAILLKNSKEYWHSFVESISALPSLRTFQTPDVPYLEYHT